MTWASLQTSRLFYPTVRNGTSWRHQPEEGTEAGPRSPNAACMRPTLCSNGEAAPSPRAGQPWCVGVMLRGTTDLGSVMARVHPTRSSLLSPHWLLGPLETCGPCGRTRPSRGHLQGWERTEGPQNKSWALLLRA